MSLSRSLQESIQHTASNSVIGICVNSYPCCDLIRNLKTYTGDVLCKSVRIFLQDRINRFPIFLIDLRSKIQ